MDKVVVKNPTQKQQEILEFIESFIDENGFSPSQKEISDYFGLASPNAVRCHIRAMAKKNLITFEPGKPRTICLAYKMVAI